jgi:hypothetical protein
LILANEVIYEKPDKIEAIKESEIDEDENHNVVDESLIDVNDYELLSKDLK